MNARTLLIAAALFAASACGMPQTEEQLLPDSDLAGVQTTQSAITSTVPAANAFHLRLAWGYLAGELRARTWVSWTGQASVTSGTAALEHLIFFERHDSPLPNPAPNTVAWSSRTLPHFDGLVLKVTPGAATDEVTVTTPLFQHTFAVAELAAGSEQHFVVDAAGHEVSVSSIPDAACEGFALGYMKPSDEGWLGFAGLVVDSHGDRLGIVRFKVENGQVRARLIGANRQVTATGQGTLDEAAHTFSLSLVKPDGTVAANLTGLYTPPAYSPRGSFQARWSCN